MLVEDRLDSLPMRNIVTPVGGKAIHIIPKLGLIRVSNGVSYGLEVYKDISDTALSLSDIPAGKYSVVAIILSVRHANSKNETVQPIGYSLINNQGILTQIAISQISRFVDSIINIDRTVPNTVLGLGLSPTTKCNIIYLHLGDAESSETRGYRLRSGAIKILSSVQLTRSYVRSLTNNDLVTLEKALNKRYFQNRVPDCKVQWSDSRIIAKSHVDLVPSSESDASSAIKGVKATSGTIYIGRAFILDNPQLLYEALLHEMIHCMGAGGHNTFFCRWVDILNGFDPTLCIAKDDSPVSTSEKWQGIGTMDIEDDACYTVFTCPVCGRDMRPSKSGYRCYCGNTLQFN